MEEEIEKLKDLSAFFKRMNNKLILLKLINMAKEQYDNCNFDEMRNYLEQGYNIDSENFVILRGLGCLKFTEGNYYEAIDFYKSALKNSPSKEIECTLIGMAFYLIDDLDNSVEYFNLAIDYNDNYTQAYEGRNQAMLENHLKIVDLQDALKKYF